MSNSIFLGIQGLKSFKWNLQVADSKQKEVAFYTVHY